jgi:two-component system, response regulator
VTEPFILLVEDNAGDEELMLRALRMGNISNPVVVARDGAAALEVLFSPDGDVNRGVPKLPRVIFLDLNLPKLGGLEVLRRIRESKATLLVPVVIVTSSCQDRDLEAGYRLGANSYVVKPVAFDEFAIMVRDLGNYWMRLNQPLAK